MRHDPAPSTCSLLARRQRLVLLGGLQPVAVNISRRAAVRQFELTHCPTSWATSRWSEVFLDPTAAAADPHRVERRASRPDPHHRGPQAGRRGRAAERGAPAAPLPPRTLERQAARHWLDIPLGDHRAAAVRTPRRPRQPHVDHEARQACESSPEWGGTYRGDSHEAALLQAGLPENGRPAIFARAGPDDGRP